MHLDSLLIVGVLVGSLSPLLTFARLFQMKEWRLDRLREHLRREGVMRTIVGSWRHMRLPVMTTKAQVIIGTSILLDIAVALFIIRFFHPAALLVLPPSQALVVFASWFLWKPVDGALKQRLLARAARHRSSFIDAVVIGIVGSVGKTTTKELLKCVLQDLKPMATPEHVNTELGVAAWLLKQRPENGDQKVFIVEMGAYRKGEIATLCRMAQPTIAVVTALGSDHLALFGSEEAIVDANAEILAALPKDGHAFLLGDSIATKQLKKRVSCPVTIAGSADATEIRDTDRGLTIESQGSRFTVALHGQHNAGNALLAIAVARSMGINDERIRELLAGYRGSGHTFHLKKERGVLILDDTYNVSPLSFKAALDWSKSRPERPRVLLTSGLLETGPDEKRFLLDLGKAAKTSVDRVVFITAAGADDFAKGFGKTVEMLSSAAPVTDDAVLVCVGRMPPSTIQKLLPNDR